MNSYDYQKIRGYKRKFELINRRGGCCEKCGYDKNIAALEFHHLNPIEKEFQIDLRHLSNTSMLKLIEEFNKCQLLCANCHREVHNPLSDKVYLIDYLSKFNDDMLSEDEKGKPKCLDCDIEINYTHKRCVACEQKRRLKISEEKKPDIELLKNEIKNKSQQWCATKYGVSRTTIRRWLGKL